MIMSCYIYILYIIRDRYVKSAPVSLRLRMGNAKPRPWLWSLALLGFMGKPPAAGLVKAGEKTLLLLGVGEIISELMLGLRDLDVNMWTLP